MNSRSLLVAVSFAAAIVATAGAASASSVSVAGCQGQSNPPIVVHRALPVDRAAHAVAARAVVVVHLSRTGRAGTIALARSSGSADFDAAALAAAKSSSFAPAARGCVARDATFQYAIGRTEGGHVTTAIVGTPRR